MHRSRYRWFVVAVSFAFILLHQADRLLIGPLTTPIMETFKINEAQMGAVFTGALVVGATFYPVWGYLCDRYARAKLLALASFIWGATTWISAVAPTYRWFLITRASSGIDDSSYPGLYSLISDHFGPAVRGKIYGLLQIAAPMGYMLGMVLALGVRDLLGWRRVFYLTGSLGIALAVIIFFGVREVARGRSEPELASLEEIGVYRFDWQLARGLFRNRTLLLLYTQGFFGVFPWNVMTYWAFRYLEKERGYASDVILVTMAVAVLMMALGQFVGGAMGDFLFQHTRRGRLLVAAAGVLMGALLLFLALSVPVGNQSLFLVMMGLATLFMPFAGPNVISTVYDVTLPEVRSTALAVQNFAESVGAATAPLLGGLIAVRLSLHDAILIVSESAWMLCAIFFFVAAYVVPDDIEVLRQAMRQRAGLERPPAVD